MEKLDVKKPRLGDDNDMPPVDDIQPDQPTVGPAADMMEDVVVETQASALPKAASKADAKGKGKAKGDGGFKENPYTFLPPDDPILQSCMYVN